MARQDPALVPLKPIRNPLSLFKQMSEDFDRMFESPWPTANWPRLRTGEATELENWMPGIDVFERDNRLVTKVDLPGMKKEDVKVEVADGQLVISGERKRDTKEKKEDYYRRERLYGSFYRSVPLPEGVKLEDVKATFADGVLEVTVPMPTQEKPAARTVTVTDASKPGA